MPEKSQNGPKMVKKAQILDISNRWLQKFGRPLIVTARSTVLLVFHTLYTLQNTDSAKKNAEKMSKWPEKRQKVPKTAKKGTKGPKML